MPHLTAFEKITAMIATGQLMRLALYSASFLVWGDSFHSPGRATYFLCDVDNPVPTPMPDLFALERLCHHCAA